MKILYLRTVYWFNCKAGGSVGHTAGVINALDQQADVDVISNDALQGVKRNIKIIKPIRPKFLPQDIGELLYSFKLILLLKNLSRYNAIYQRYSGHSFVGAYLAKKI